LKNILWLLFINLFLFSCNNNNTDLSPKLQRIELAGDLAKKEFEASSLAWYKNYLIILPQFPHKWDKQFDGAIYFISQKELNNYISGEDKSPIKGEKIHFIADGLDEIGKRDGSGYEAITFINDKVFVSIESIDKDSSSSFIVEGNLDFENRKLVLDKNSKYEIKSQTNIYNMGEEAIFTHKNYIYALHEANGININKSPFSTKLDIELNFVSKIGNFFWLFSNSSSTASPIPNPTAGVSSPPKSLIKLLYSPPPSMLLSSFFVSNASNTMSV